MASRRLLLARPAFPLAGILVLAFAAAGLRTAGTDWPLVGAGAAAAALVLGAAAAVPWDRLAPTALLVLPVAADGVIGVLRQAQGGSTSGYSPLAILPVLWVGLALRGRAAAAMTAATAAFFAVPIALVGPPAYPATGWRGAVLWTAVAAVVGVAANRVMSDQRRQTRVAAARARELRQLVATQSALATSDFDLEAVMTTVADNALSLAGADGAVVELPEGDELVYRAAAGIALPLRGLRVPLEASIAGVALRTRRAQVCRDAAVDARVEGGALRLGTRSIVAVPLVHDDRATGVLEVFHAGPNAFGDGHAEVLTLLASMIGTALVRAELLRKLKDEAITDELTGLPNRRAWWEELDHALGRARRSGLPLSVIALDLDGLKQVNDTLGHAAGDRLLRTVAARWSAVIRETDMLGRLGGDEFGVLVEGADETVAGYLLTRLAESTIDDGHASAGIATWDGEEDAYALVARADAVMYEHKRRRAAVAS